MDASPTILIDGIFGRPRRFGRLRGRLEAATGPTAVYHYNSTGVRRFEDLAAGLIGLVRETADRHGGPVNVIGFSMGGIVARTARLIAPDLPLRRAAFLHVPHRGTVLAYALPLPGVRQLRPNSELLTRLDAADWPIPTIVTWSPFDFVILPGGSARWARATESVRCPVPLHNWPIWSGGVHRRIVDFLTGPDELQADAA